MLSLVRKIHQKDIELMERLSSTPFYSGFWNRVRIDGAIRHASSNAHGVLLDVGCGGKRYANVFAPFVKRYLGLEYSRDSGYRANLADFCADALQLPLLDKSVDTVLCTEVLEHLDDPEKAIAEIARVLRADGVVITTAPFFFPIHDAADFFRYSRDGVASLMRRNGLKVETVQPLSGSGVTLALLFNLFWFESGFMWTKWLYPFGVVLRPFLLLLCLAVNLLGGVLEMILPSTRMSFNHLTIARKR